MKRIVCSVWLLTCIGIASVTGSFTDGAAITDAVGGKGSPDPGLPVILQQPAHTLACVGNPASFTVGANGPATVQWQRRAPGTTNFVNIANATNATYVTSPVSAADDGSAFRAIVTESATSLASSHALLGVIAISSPTASYNFNSGLPPNTAMYGSTFVSDGILELNANVMSQSGAFLMPDLAPGHLVRGFAATFRVRMQRGSFEPGDGFSFNWATDLPNSVYVTGEEGEGSGLRVCFDTYNNGFSEAPAIDVKWGTNVIGHYLTTNDFLPGFANDFAAVAIRLNTDGTLDVSYRCTPIFTRLVITNYTPLINARFGLGSRAGAAFESHSIDDLALQAFIDQTNGVPRIISISNQAPTSVVISGTGTPGGNVALEASTNLVNWSWRTNVLPNASGVWQFAENPAGYPHRFYRARSSAQLPTNLVSWWRAEGNYLDSFGGNHGGSFNGFGPTFTNGQRGQAFSFASNNQAIALTGAAPIPVPWTACFWVKRQDTTNSSAALLSDGATALKLEQAVTPRRVGFSRFGVADYSFSYSAPTNVWTHLTFAATPGRTILYVNGEPNGTNLNTINLPRQLIGARPTGVDYMRGQLDETVLFNRALSPAEIQQVIHATRGP